MSTITEEATDISADEVALYDRQIRLWGLEAQNRMRNSKILVINLSAVASEVVKNIVLAGIGALIILDDHTVELNDLAAQFFIEEMDTGKNRAEAASPRVQKLNPRVELKADTRSLASIPDEWFGQFDVVVASELKCPDLVRVNDAVRKAGNKFYACGLFGMTGYVFADLVDHTFKIVGPETATRQIVGVDTKKDGEKFLETITKTEKYTSLAGVIDKLKQDPHTFSSQYTTRRLLKTSPLLPLLLAYWESSSHLDKPLFALAQGKARELSIPTSIVTESFADSFLPGVEISPVAAVVGGVLAQDLLNVLGGKEQPIQNLFLFDGSSSDGPIYCL